MPDVWLGDVMKIFLLFSLFLLCSSCLPPQDGCRPNTTTCMNDRPYVCSGTGRWTPVGDTACADVEAVCCRTSDEVHACVPQAACVGE